MKEIFDRVAELADQNVLVNEGDYQKDGLWYCGKCNTRKQVEVEFLGERRKVMCLCECEQKKDEDALREAKLRERQKEFERLRKETALNPAANFAADDGQNPKMAKVAHNFVDKFGELKNRGKGLVWYGDVGTGKTFYASCISNALIDHGYRCLFASIMQIEKALSASFDGREQFMIDLATYDLVVLDDFGTERDTEYINEIVYDVVNAVYENGAVLVVTTNLMPDDFLNPSDMFRRKTYSRLFEMCYFMNFEGEDRRKQKMKADHEEIKNILIE